MIVQALVYYAGVYYNTPPPGKKFFIQLRIVQAGGDGVEGDHQVLGLELTAEQAMVDEEEAEVEEQAQLEDEAEVEEDGHVESAEEQA